MTEHFSKDDIVEARVGFERLARRLDELWQKDRLSKKEEREIQLILNNAAVLSEILEGREPEEFREERRVA